MFICFDDSFLNLHCQRSVCDDILQLGELLHEIGGVCHGHLSNFERCLGAGIGVCETLQLILDIMAERPANEADVVKVCEEVGDRVACG